MEYISKKDYLEKNKKNTIVGYALLVEDNIKKDDYAKLNTGEIVKVLGIKENNCNKKAIYYGPCYYENKWFDCSAVENFSKNIIDLIQCGDYVNGSLVISDTKNTRTETCDGEEHKCIIVSRSKDDVLGWKMIDFDIKDILTKEQYEQNSFKL